MRALACAAIALFLVAAACGKAAPSGPDGGPVLTNEGCYLNPSSNAEILNACTDAGFIDKHPSLPLLLPDGGLPPLP